MGQEDTSNGSAVPRNRRTIRCTEPPIAPVDLPWSFLVFIYQFVAVAGRSAASVSRFDGLRFGVFAPLRFYRADFNAETQSRKDAERIWAGAGSLPSFHCGVGERDRRFIE